MYHKIPRNWWYPHWTIERGDIYCFKSGHGNLRQ